MNTLTVIADQAFEKAVSCVLLNEGGLVQNLNDPGGITNYGISLRFLKEIPADRLRSYGIPIAGNVRDIADSDYIKNLTIEQAKAIYKGEFWSKADFEKINSQDVINAMFDMTVNAGIAPAIKCVQRACWSVMKSRDCLKEDGVLGPNTIEMVNRCGSLLIAAIRSERASDYRLVARSDPKESIFEDGWIRRAYGT